MGKEGIRIVIQFFTDEGIQEEDAQAIAQYYLERYRFIYLDPNSDESAMLSVFSHRCMLTTCHSQDDNGAFKSPLILLALAAHLKMTIGNEHLDGEGYPYPVGGLAVATAVVSCHDHCSMLKINYYSLD